MYQSSFQQPRILYQGAKNGKKLNQSSMINGNGQFGGQNYLMPQYYPQYMQEKATKGAGFLGKFSHFPFLPESMSTTAKGLCGFLTMLFFIILVVIAIGLTPLYMKIAENSSSLSNPENQLEEFSIDLRNGIQLSDARIARIISKPESEWTEDEKSNVTAAIDEFELQLNEKTKPKLLIENIDEIYNVRFEPVNDDLIDVSYTVRTKPISESDGNKLRTELFEKLEDPNLYDNIILSSEESILNNPKLDSDSMSELIKGDLKSNLKIVNRNKYMDNKYNEYHRKSSARAYDDLSQGAILFPRPYELYNDYQGKKNRRGFRQKIRSRFNVRRNSKNYDSSYEKKNRRVINSLNTLKRRMKNNEYQNSYQSTRKSYHPNEYSNMQNKYRSKMSSRRIIRLNRRHKGLISNLRRCEKSNYNDNNYEYLDTSHNYNNNYKQNHISNLKGRNNRLSNRLNRCGKNNQEYKNYLKSSFKTSNKVDESKKVDLLKAKQGVKESEPVAVTTLPKKVTIPTKVPTIPTKVPTIPTKVPTIPTKVPTIPKKVPTIPKTVPTIPKNVEVTTNPTTVEVTTNPDKKTTSKPKGPVNGFTKPVPVNGFKESKDAAIIGK